MSGEDATFNVLRRSPFREVVKECFRRQKGKTVFVDNDEYIRSQGWSLEEFSSKLDNISNAEWVEIIGEPARGTN